MWPWLILILVVLLALVASIIYNHHVMKRRWEEASYHDVEAVREAADKQNIANNLKNPILRLKECEGAYTATTLVLRRYGLKRASELVGADVEKLHMSLQEQRVSILERLSRELPDLLPREEMDHYVTYATRRDAAVVTGVRQFEEPDLNYRTEYSGGGGGGGRRRPQPPAEQKKPAIKQDDDDDHETATEDEDEEDEEAVTNASDSGVTTSVY